MIEDSSERQRYRLEMSDTAKENSVPNPMKKIDLLSRQLRDSRVLLDKYAVKYYFSSKLLSVNDRTLRFSRRRRKRNNLDKNSSIREKEKTVDDFDHGAMLIEVESEVKPEFVYKQECDDEQATFVRTADPQEQSMLNNQIAFENVDESIVRLERQKKFVTSNEGEFFMNNHDCDIIKEEIDDKSIVIDEMVHQFSQNVLANDSDTSGIPIIQEDDVTEINPNVSNRVIEATRSNDNYISGDTRTTNYESTGISSNQIKPTRSKVNPTPDSSISKKFEVDNCESRGKKLNRPIKLTEKILYDNLKDKQVLQSYHCNDCRYKCFYKSQIRLHIQRRHTDCLESGPRVKENLRGSVKKVAVTKNSHGSVKKLCVTKASHRSVKKVTFTANSNKSVDRVKKKVKEKSEKIINDDLIKMHCCKCNETSDIKRGLYNARIMECSNCNTVRKFKCIKCGRLSDRFKAAWDHYIFACEPQQHYKCQICDYKCTRKYVFFRHQKLHTKFPTKEFKGHWNTKSKDSGINMYCDKCDETTKFERNLRLKIMMRCRNCSSDRQFKCVKCGKNFSKFLHVTNHIKFICNPKELFKCTYCDYSSTRKATTIRHQQIHIRSFAKNKPGISVDENKGWKSISFEVIKQDSQTEKLSIAGESPMDNSNLSRNNRKIITNGEICFCNECNYEVFGKRNIQFHILKEHGTNLELNYCSKCGRIYDNPLRMKLHELVCGLKYNCKFCPKTWTRQEDIKTHLQKYHYDKLGSKTAAEVGKEILVQLRADRDAILRSFQENARVTGNTQFQTIITDDMMKLHCTGCNKTSNFERKGVYRIQRNCLTCGTLRQFECSKCGQRFKAYMSVRGHVQFACDPQKYIKCDLCDYKSTRKQCMITHEKLHKSERRMNNSCSSTISKDTPRRASRGYIFSCNDCDYYSYHKDELRAHIMNKHHTSDKSHCSKCGEVFRSIITLRRHRASCGVALYKCIYCPRSWRRANVFIKTHLTSKHSIEFGSKNLREIHAKIIRKARCARAELQAKCIPTKKDEI